MSGSRCRAWCFTVNNYTDADIEKLEKSDHTYLIYGKEVGEKGTPHLQGYIETENGKTLRTMKKKYHETAHWEVRRGSAKQASEYCKKEKNFKELGEMTRQGDRTDIAEMVTRMKEGARRKEIIEEYPAYALRYMNNIVKMLNQFQKERDTPPEVVWIWGETGVGKTRMVFDYHGKDNIYVKDHTQWWDGYQQEDAILIDDFGGGWHIKTLLTVCDRYKCQGQVKGGYIQINSPHIYITSDRPPSAFYEGKDLEQLERRITHVINLRD